MNIVKSYNNFLLEKLNNKQESSIQKIVKYLESKGNLEMFEFDETFDVVKSDKLNLTGKLYFLKDGRAVRFNFYKNTNNLESVDLWLDFSFVDSYELYDKPSKTLKIKNDIFNHLTVNIFKYFSIILKFIKKEKINENITVKEDYIESETTDSENFEETIKNDIKIEEPEPEKVTLKSLGFSETLLEHDIDIFETMKMFVSQVAFRISRSVLILGSGGVGKSYTVFETIEKLNAKYVKISGDISTAGLYELLYHNKDKDKLIVFDDCDSLWDNSDSVNYLKAILDTSSKRLISSIKKVNYFNSVGLSNDEIDIKYKLNGGSKLPNQFEFLGGVIFISNKDVKDFDKATLTRLLYLSINLTKQEIIERIKKIMPDIKPNVSLKLKENTLQLIEYFTSNFECSFPLNLRTFVLSLEIRMANDFKTTVNGETVPAYEFLIKRFLLKPKI